MQLMSNQIPVHDVTPPNKNANNSVDLYASREKIYTRAFTGLFRNLRMTGGAVLFLLYFGTVWLNWGCLLYTSPSPRDGLLSRMPSSA